tara:strand:- start:472 stop:714 length:243 start_codon:yes stop_codon:yes gene_type:complete
MDLQSRKLQFIQEFLKLQSEEVIARLEKILKKEGNSNGENEFEPMSVKEFNDRIDKSMEDSKNGKLTKASDLKAQMEKWI